MDNTKADTLNKLVFSSIKAVAETSFNAGRNDLDHTFEDLDLMIYTMSNTLLHQIYDFVGD